MGLRYRRALIMGVTGQDGAYLAQLLLDRGVEVFGTSRDIDPNRLHNLRRMGVAEKVAMRTCTLSDFRSVLQVLSDVEADVIFNLAGQSSVSLSFREPIETFDGTAIGTINILEALRFLKSKARFYNAASGDCFGQTDAGPVDETAPFRPRSPYAVAKCAAFWATANYREAYALDASSGLLFNHESPLRPAHFVTQKVVRGAIDIAEKRCDHLGLGNLLVARDWGWAPEFVEAMVLIAEHEQPDDFIIATGEVNTLEDFVAEAFRCVGLNWRNHVSADPQFFRPTDVSFSVGNADKAARVLGWRAQTRMRDVVRRLIEAELERRHGYEQH